jgi:hypothetical protein
MKHRSPGPVTKENARSKKARLLARQQRLDAERKEIQSRLAEIDQVLQEERIKDKYPQALPEMARQFNIEAAVLDKEFRGNKGELVKLFEQRNSHRCNLFAGNVVCGSMTAGGGTLIGIGASSFNGFDASPLALMSVFVGGMFSFAAISTYLEHATPSYKRLRQINKEIETVREKHKALEHKPS